MNSKTLSIVIKAQDEASRVIENVGSRTQNMADKVQKASGVMAGLGATAGVALYALIGSLNGTVTSANRAEAAMIGLSSISRAFGVDANLAKQAAQSLSRDGLMSIGDAATGLKNLLAAGFELPNAIQLMERFKDSAAFGRQGSLEFGQAIVAATEGVKNGNSILVDNAGVTKNLSNMLIEAGYSAQDLSRASEDAGVRQAIFNGIMRETNAQLGDAALYADTAAGAQARMTAETEKLKVSIGTAVNSALLPFLQAITPIIERITQWVNENQRLAGAIAIGTVIFLGLIAVLGAVAVAIAAVMAIAGSAAAVVIAIAVAIAAALAAAVATIIYNWNSIKAFFSSIPGHVSNALNALPGIIFNIFNAMTHGALGIVWNMRGSIYSALAGLAGSVASAVSGVWGALTSPFQSAYNTISGIIGSIKGAINSIKNVGGKAWDAIKGAVPGFATGGYTGRGGANEVAGIVHKGEYVVPKSQVDQSTGLPMMGNATFNMYGSINLGDSSAVDRFFDRLNAQKELGNLGVGV